MPTLTWTITAEDRDILGSLAAIERAADRARGAVQQIGRGGTGGSAGASQLTRDFQLLTGQVMPAVRAVDSFGKISQQAASHAATLSSRITAIGQGLLIYKGFTFLETSISHLVQATLQLPAAFEQSEIGFTAMLDGNRQAADAMLAQIQQLANVTPFRFTGEQQAARTLLGLGQAAEKVLPELVDIDTAVAAVGGGEEMVLRVAAALGKMSAEGRVSAIFMNELTRDGIPAWRMLAEEMGVPVAKVRELSENGEIAASTFEKAFHDYTVRHFGDALTQQSQTFSGLISTAQDLGEQFLRVFGMPIIQELEPKLRGALQALQDPRVLATIQQWGQGAAVFVGWLFQAVGAVAQLLGMPVPDLSQGLGDASDKVKEFAGDWSTANDTVSNTKGQIAGINREIRQAEIDLRRSSRAADATELSYKHQSDEISNQIRLLDEKYERENRDTSIAGLRAKIAKDERLAVDVYSSQGQAAAKRLVDERAQLAQQLREKQHTTDKQALEDQKRGVEARAQTFREETQRQRQQAQDHIDDLRQQALDLQNAGTTPGGGGGGGGAPKPNIRIAGDSLADRYAQVVGDAVAGKAPALLARLFGTPEERQQAITDFFSDLGTIVGSTPGDPIIQSLKTNMGQWIAEGLQPENDKIGQAITAFDHSLAAWFRGDTQNVLPEFRAVMGDSIWSAILHPPDPKDDAFGAFMTNLDQTLAKGVRHALGIPDDADFGKTDFWKNETAAFDKANKQIADAVTAPFTNAAATTHRQRSRPTATPTGHTSGTWIEGKYYQDGTTDWTWQDSATSQYSQYYGGRARGGPVGEGWFTVGEHGPELLHAGGPGYVTPNYALPVTGASSSPQQLTITVRTERGEVLGIVATAIQQQVSGKFVAQRMAAYASR